MTFVIHGFIFETHARWAGAAGFTGVYKKRPKYAIIGSRAFWEQDLSDVKAEVKS